MMKKFFTDQLAQLKIEQALRIKSLEESHISELKKPWKFGKS